MSNLQDPQFQAGFRHAVQSMRTSMNEVLRPPLTSYMTVVLDEVLRNFTMSTIPIKAEEDTEPAAIEPPVANSSPQSAPTVEDEGKFATTNACKKLIEMPRLTREGTKCNLRPVDPANLKKRKHEATNAGTIEAMFANLAAAGKVIKTRGGAVN